jgi:hypothetical protein
VVSKLPALLLVVFLPGLAAAQTRVAFYGPWGGPSDAEKRHLIAQGFARGFEKGEGQVFAKYKDFEAALGAGKLDYAIVDSAAALRAGKKVRVLASWQSGETWALLAPAGVAAPALLGKKLALAAGDAPGTTALVEDTLFRGQAPLKTFFGGTVAVPLPADGVKAVELGKADAAVARRGDAGSLEVVVELGTWAELALVAAPAAPPAGDELALAAARGALSGGIWSPGAPALRGPVALTKPVLARPAPLGRRLRDLFSPLELPPPALPIDALWAPPTDEL